MHSALKTAGVKPGASAPGFFVSGFTRFMAVYSDSVNEIRINSDRFTCTNKIDGAHCAELES
jgi:hypothetical protein